MPETITIKFRPEGDKELIQAINALAKAQLQLENKTKKLSKEQIQGAKIMNKHETSIHKLTIKLKALGSGMGKVTGAAKLKKAALKGDEVAMHRLTFATNKHIASMKKQNNGLFEASHAARQTSGAFSVLRSQLLLVQFALSLGIRQLVKFAQAATKIQSMGRAFTTLSGGTNNASIAMKKLQDATDGTMSKFDLFQQANNAMILGVTKNSDEMAEMFDIAQRLGEALGKDTALSVASLVEGIGRQSKQMLDNIGIMMSATDAYEAYAAKLNISADSLTDTQKKQAFLTATMDSARQKVAGLPEEIMTAEKAFQQLGASTEDAAASLGEALLPLLVPITELLKDALESMDTPRVKRWALAIASGATAWGLLTLGVKGYAAVAKIATARTLSLSAAMAKNPIGLLAVGLSLAIGTLLEYKGVFEGAVEETDKLNDKTKELTDTEKIALEVKAALVEKAKQLKDAQDEGYEALRKRLLLMEATTETEKYQIEVGRKLSEAEYAFLYLIEKRIEREKKANEAKKIAQKIAETEISSLKDIIKVSLELQKIESQGDPVAAIRLQRLQKEEEIRGQIRTVLQGLGIDVGFYEKVLTEGNLSFLRLLDSQGNFAKESSALLLVLNKLFVAQGKVTDEQAYAAILYGKTEEAQKASKDAMLVWVKANEDAFKITGSYDAVLKMLNGTIDENSEALDKANKALAEAKERAEAFGAVDIFSSFAEGFGGTIDMSAFEKLKEAQQALADVDLTDSQAKIDADTEVLNAQIALRENFYMQMGEMTTQFLESELAKKESSIREEGKRELDQLRASEKYKRASDKKKKAMEDKIVKEKNKKLKDNWRIQKALSIAQVGMDTARAIMGIWAEVPKSDLGISAGAMTAMVGALGATQIAMITSQSAPKFAQGGMIGGSRHAFGGTMIEAERGEFIMSRNAVESVGLETMNRINEGGGSNIVVNFSGNVMSNDFVENEAIPQIKEAIRRGADIGIA